MSLEDIVATFRSALAGVAPIDFGQREVSAFSSTPRYVWVPVRAEFLPTRSVGRNPRSIFSRNVESRIFCFAIDYRQVERLEQAFLTVLRANMAGNSSLLESVYDTPEWLTHGVLTQLRVAMILPIPEFDLTSSPPYFGDRVRRTGQVIYADIDPGEPVAGDKNLDGLEG